jgi:26S proteasome regulatory subunit N8
MAPTKTVHVHPLVLLSVVDHYHRVAKETKKRVVGVLLGSVSKDEVDVTNSFAGECQHLAGDTTGHTVDSLQIVLPDVRLQRVRAGPLTPAACCAVPFEEDAKDPTIWFMDHSYMENMSRMFRKVNGVQARHCVCICVAVHGAVHVEVPSACAT